MIKLPFRYALSTWYAKLIIDDLYLAFHIAGAVGSQQYLVLFDPLLQSYYQTQSARGTTQSTAKHPNDNSSDKQTDNQAYLLAEEARIDLKAGEIQVFFWNRMNAGYVFRRIFLPSNWKEFLDEKELKAIIGHEIGHLKLGSDSMIPMRFVNRLGDEFLYMLLPTNLVGYFLLLTTLISQNPAYIKALSLTFAFRFVHILIENYFARKDEYKADQYGKKVSSADSMITALTKIERLAKIEAFENLNLLPHGKQWYYHWLLKKDRGRLREYLLDHPYLHNRIRALKI